MYKYQYPIVLSIAGSDSSGGAGIQADLKTFSALGCYGTTAITAITVQNTLGVSAIHAVPADIVIGQIRAVMDDIKPSAIKIGMVYNAKLVTAIARLLKEYANVPIVFDPVIVSSGGNQLTDNNAIAVFKNELFPLVQLLTPNIDEAALITGVSIKSIDDMKAAAINIVKMGCNAVLVKGSHLKGADLYDVYLDKTGHEHIFRSKAIDSNNTHGTGCSLSSAIASFIATGDNLITAIKKGKYYVHQAIQHGHDIEMGNGHGPLNHFFDPKKLIKSRLV